MKQDVFTDPAEIKAKLAEMRKRGKRRVAQPISDGATVGHHRPAPRVRPDPDPAPRVPDEKKKQK